MNTAVATRAKHPTLSTSLMAGMHTDVLYQESQRLLNGTGPFLVLGSYSFWPSYSHVLRIHMLRTRQCKMMSTSITDGANFVHLGYTAGRAFFDSPNDLLTSDLSSTGVNIKFDESYRETLEHESDNSDS